MQTYLITKEQVQSYLFDYWTRIKIFAEKNGVPVNDLRWILLGKSGWELFRVLVETLQHKNEIGSFEASAIIASQYNRKKKDVELFKIGSHQNNKSPAIDNDDFRFVLKDKIAIILDSSVHSGTSMQTLAKEIQNYAPREVTTYSLVLKRNSKFIPNHFGILIHDWDRALFLLDSIPNNRMRFGGSFRTITDDSSRDIAFPQWLSTSTQSGWGRYIDAYNNEGAQIVVFVDKDNTVHSLLDFRIENQSNVSVCCVKRLVVAPHFKHDASKYNELVAAPLLRWAMTYARHCNCSKITISCKALAVDSYKKMDFKETDLPGAPSEHTVLEKKILYNVPFSDDIINNNDDDC